MAKLGNKSGPFGTVEHLKQSAPAKIEKHPGPAFGKEHPSGGMGRKNQPGQEGRVSMSRTKDFPISHTSEGGNGEFEKGPTNQTGRALATAMIGAGQGEAHVRRVSEEATKGAGMGIPATFKH